jgi:sulfur-oxidizing protein SoxY
MQDDSTIHLDEFPSATRRRILIGTAALAGMVGMGISLTVRPAAATPQSMRAAIKKVVGEAPVTKGRLKMDLPPLIENGNAVPLTIAGESPMSAADHIKAIHVFTEKNPQPNVVSIYLGPRAGRANVSTRIRLADTQKVVAIAEMSDGTFWSEEVEIVVTLAACLEES